MEMKKKNIERKVMKPGKAIIASKAESLRKRVRKLTGGEAKAIVMDFSGVETVDAVGLGIIIATHNTLKAVGGSLTLTEVPEEIGNSFTAMGLDRHFQVETAH